MTEYTDFTNVFFTFVILRGLVNMCKCNFIYTHEESTALHELVFMKLTLFNIIKCRSLQAIFTQIRQ